MYRLRKKVQKFGKYYILFIDIYLFIYRYTDYIYFYCRYIYSMYTHIYSTKIIYIYLNIKKCMRMINSNFKRVVVASGGERMGWKKGRWRRLP